MIFHHCLIIHIICRMLCKDFFFRDHQRNGKMENIFPRVEAAEQGPVGLPGTEAFLVPISYRQDCSLHDLLWVKGQNRCWSKKDADTGSIVSNSFVTQWTQNRLPFLPPGGLPNSGIKPKSPVLAGGFFTTALIRTPDHLRPCTQLHLVSNPILLQLCRGNKNTRLLLPWSLAYIPSGWYNISLLTREGA